MWKLRRTNDFRRRFRVPVHLPAWAKQRLEPVPDSTTSRWPCRRPADWKGAYPVLTEKNTSIVLAAANEPQVDEDGPQYSLTGRDVKELKNSPNFLVHATGGVAETRNFLGRFIAGI